jgi:hypothetical protein
LAQLSRSSRFLFSPLLLCCLFATRFVGTKLRKSGYVNFSSDSPASTLPRDFYIDSTDSTELRSDFDCPDFRAAEPAAIHFVRPFICNHHSTFLCLSQRNTAVDFKSIGQELHLLWLYGGCTGYRYLAQRARRMPRQPIFVSLSTTPINASLSWLSLYTGSSEPLAAAPRPEPFL